jgi:hypothetical protein
MRIPIYKVRNDDNPLDPQYPIALSEPQLRDVDEREVYDQAIALLVGQSVTVGGGAAVQFTIERIR